MPSVRFGILGCGSAAVPVAEALAALPNASLTLVHDIDERLARDISDRFHVPFTTNLSELINADLDAIYIAVPHHLLAGLATQVLNAGKSVLVEKPLALTVADADALIALAASKNLALGVFYELRYAPVFAAAREMVQQGALGEIIGVQIETLIDKAPTYWQVGYSGRSANSWRGEKQRAGGGVVLMNTSHFLDALWFVTGLNIVRVQAEVDALVANVEVEDTAVATFRFENGAMGNLISGAHLGGSHRDEHFTLYGKQGTLRLSDPYGNDPYQVYFRREWNELAPNLWHTITLPAVNVFERALADFADAVQAHASAPINGTDARRVLQTVLAIYQSAQEHCAVTIDHGGSHETS